jgi:hypothetical protein
MSTPGVSIVGKLPIWHSDYYRGLEQHDVTHTDRP